MRRTFGFRGVNTDPAKNGSGDDDNASQTGNSRRDSTSFGTMLSSEEEVTAAAGSGAFPSVGPTTSETDHNVTLPPVPDGVLTGELPEIIISSFNVADH